MNNDDQVFILNDAHHLVSYKLWSPQELRTLAKDFPKDAAIHFADEFNLISRLMKLAVLTFIN